MGLDLGEANLSFLQAITDDPEWALEEQTRLRDYNRENGALYGGAPLEVTLKPELITPEQRHTLETASHHLVDALSVVVEELISDPDLAQAWGIGEAKHRLCQVDPGYEPPIPVARFDGFLDGDDLTFLEFNTDSPAGPGYGDVIQRGFEAFVDRNPHLGEGLALPAMRRLDRLQAALLGCYRQWRTHVHPDRRADPVTVVTDWRDVSSRPDSDLVVDHLRKNGVDARFADPRDLELDGDQLVHETDVVDLVYKRVIVDELVEEPDAQALAHAFEAGEVCMANPPRSVIAGDKRVMAALSWDRITERLNSPQRRAVDRFVPWTRVLKPGKTTVQGFTVDLRDFVLDNQDKLVLKAAVSYGGRDVALGPLVDEETWGRIVDENIKDGTWVVQGLVDLPKGLFPRVDEEGVRLEALNVNVNPFVFGGSFGGSYTRVSGEEVINVAAGGGLAPTVTLETGGEGS